MLSYSDIKVGMLVVYVNRLHPRNAKLAKISSFNSFEFSVEWIDGSDTFTNHWSYFSGFSKASNKITYSELDPNKLVVGDRIFSFARYERAKWYNKFGEVICISNDSFYIKWDDDLHDNMPWNFNAEFLVVSGGKGRRKPKKVTPDIPLDPTLPILQAGYLQDRQRKQFR